MQASAATPKEAKKKLGNKLETSEVEIKFGAGKKSGYAELGGRARRACMTPTAASVSSDLS